MWWLLGLSDTKDALVRANLANLQVLKRRLYPGLVSLFCLGHGGALSQGLGLIFEKRGGTDLSYRVMSYDSSLFCEVNLGGGDKGCAGSCFLYLVLEITTTVCAYRVHTGCRPPGGTQVPGRVRIAWPAVNDPRRIDDVRI